MTASDSARSRCASARASGLVIHLLEPSAAAIRPSSDAPNFQVITGRSAVMPASPGPGRGSRPRDDRAMASRKSEAGKAPTRCVLNRLRGRSGLLGVPSRLRPQDRRRWRGRPPADSGRHRGRADEWLAAWRVRARTTQSPGGLGRAPPSRMRVGAPRTQRCNSGPVQPRSCACR
jgi:hypothetical protein